MALATGCEQPAKVLLILARKRTEWHLHRASAAMCQLHVSVAHADKFGFILLSRHIAPDTHFRHELRRDKTWPTVEFRIGLRRGLIGRPWFNLSWRGAERDRRLFDL